MLGPDFPDVLAAARRADEHAFAQLWRDLQPPLLRYLRAMGADSPEDLASEVWIDIAHGLDGFHGDEGGFRAWLFTIARRRLVDARRRAARTPVVSVPDPERYEVAAADFTAAAAMERLSTERALALISNLPPDQAEVIILRAIAGLDVATVARLVGKSPGAVRVTAHRGLRRLAALLTDHDAARGVTR